MAHQNARVYRESNDYAQSEKSQKQAAPSPAIQMKKLTPPQKGSAPKIFIAMTCVGLLLCCVIYGKVQTDKIYNEISDAKKTQEVATSENVRMQSEIEGRMTIKNVEDYAENVLGLKKLDKSQIEYVEVQSDDVVEIPEEDKNIFVKIKDAFSDFVEYIFD